MSSRLLLSLPAVLANIDISTRVADWQGIPNLDNPWIGYPVIDASEPANWLGQGRSQTYVHNGNCPVYRSCLQGAGCTPGQQFSPPGSCEPVNGDTVCTPAIPGCSAGCVAWEATLRVNLPAGQGRCAIISGTVAADDNIAISVVNGRFPQGTYIIGSGDPNDIVNDPPRGIGTWDRASVIPAEGQRDPVTNEGYFDDGPNTLTLRIDNRITCLMLAAYVNARIDTDACPRAASPPPPLPGVVPVVAVFDPHFTFHHGGRADFKGKDNTWYNLLSAKDVSLNVLFGHADFSLTKPQKRLVHGSRMQDMAMSVLTSTGRKIVIEYNSTANNGKVRSAIVREELKGRAGAMHEIGSVMATSDPTPGNGLALMNYHRSKTVDNVRVTMARKQVASMAAIALTVSTGKWEVTAWSVPFPNPHAHPGKTLLNVKIAPVAGYDPEKDVVAPHGIIGQSYDGDDEGIDGAVDEYTGAEFTTRAMAEGAIEGAADEYEMPTKYATDFKYSRWGLEKAAPRDTSKLTGARVSKQRRDAAGAAGASPDVAPTVAEVKSVEERKKERKAK